jgi:hypothetical protein
MPYYSDTSHVINAYRHLPRDTSYKSSRSIPDGHGIFKEERVERKKSRFVSETRIHVATYCMLNE